MQENICPSFQSEAAVLVYLNNTYIVYFRGEGEGHCGHIVVVTISGSGWILITWPICSRTDSFPCGGQKSRHSDQNNITCSLSHEKTIWLVEALEFLNSFLFALRLCVSFPPGRLHQCGMCSGCLLTNWLSAILSS